MANLDEYRTFPSKTELFQPTRMPPEVPSDDTKAYLLNLLGANVLTEEGSKCCLLVSCKQNMAQVVSSILALTALHLPSEFTPNVPI
jgi:hypothetical protein